MLIMLHIAAEITPRSRTPKEHMDLHGEVARGGPSQAPIYNKVLEHKTRRAAPLQHSITKHCSVFSTHGYLHHPWRTFIIALEK